jgi:hypothetical protein
MAGGIKNTTYRTQHLDKTPLSNWVTPSALYAGRWTPNAVSQNKPNSISLVSGLFALDYLQNKANSCTLSAAR